MTLLLSAVTAALDKRWRVADPALRFRLDFVEPPCGDVERGRGDLALARNNSPVVDLVGADHSPASAVAFAGVIKWRSKGSVTKAEVDALTAYAKAVPGATASIPLVAVCASARVRDRRIEQSWTA